VLYLKIKKLGMHRKITGYRIFGVIFFSDVGYPVGQLSNRILNISQDIRSDIWNKDSKKSKREITIIIFFIFPT